MATRLCMCVTVFAGFLIPAARGEGVSTVSGTGASYLEKAPEVLRLTAELRASGKDMGEALKLLKQKREAASGKLKELGLSDAQVRWEGPKLPPSPQQSLPGVGSVRMLNGRMVMGGAPQHAEDDAEAPKAVLTLVAEWSLASKDSGAVLEQFAAIKAKVEKADLMGRKLDKTEEEENDSGSGSSPTWQFVAHLSEAERAKMLADAFAQAKKNAGQLAVAAGLRLGTVSSVTGRYISSNENDRTFPLVGSGVVNWGSDEPEEMVGSQPHKVHCGAQVTVSFQVQP